MVEHVALCLITSFSFASVFLFFTLCVCCFGLFFFQWKFYKCCTGLSHINVAVIVYIVCLNGDPCSSYNWNTIWGMSAAGESAGSNKVAMLKSAWKLGVGLQPLFGSKVGGRRGTGESDLISLASVIKDALENLEKATCFLNIRLKTTQVKWVSMRCEPKGDKGKTRWIGKSYVHGVKRWMSRGPLKKYD